jgi:Kef-type K+ transport system membrane component KefB
MNYLPSLPIEITPLMAFGMVLLIGAIGGYVAHRLSWLPSITGFIAVGLLVGPSGVGLLDQETIARSRVLIDIALGLILYRLGLSLNIRLLWQTPGLVLTSLVESAVTFGLVAAMLMWLGIPSVPALLVAAISISSSPAVLLHVAHESGAAGPVTEMTKTLVALNSLLSYAVFTAILPLMHYEAGADLFTMLFQPFYRLSGSLLLGVLAGVVLHTIARKTRHASQYRLALVIGVVMLAVGLAAELRLSALLIPLVVGVMIRTLEEEVVISNLEFGPAFELFFITLFVLAGASLHFSELIDYAPAVLALVFARSFAKVAATGAASSLLGRPMRQGISAGLLLIPIAGLAIGLVNTSSVLFPQQASLIAAIVLGAVTIFETIGPPLAALAFRLSGEAGRQPARRRPD